MQVIFCFSRSVFGVVDRYVDDSQLIYYRPANSGMVRRATSAHDVLDLSNFIHNKYDWQQTELEMINMAHPEFSLESLLEASTFVRNMKHE